MKGVLDDQTIPIECSNCGRKTPRSIGWLKTNSKLTCACGTEIEIKTDQFRGEIAKVDRALKDFERRLKSAFKSK